MKFEISICTLAELCAKLVVYEPVGWHEECRSIMLS